MVRVDKTTSNYSLQQLKQELSRVASDSLNISFQTEQQEVKEGYALMGLELGGNPPHRLMRHVNDTIRQHIKEDSPEQIRISRGYKGSKAHWCAFTVTYFLQENGLKDLPKNYDQVSGYIDWAKQRGRYNEVKTPGLSNKNYKSQVAVREKAVRDQFASMKEGDLIIWKSNSLRTSGSGIQTVPVSHIGIVTSIDTKNGKIKVAEGNANLYETTTRNGISGVRTGKKTLPSDMLMEKTYDAHDLTVGGYSGYIRMDGLVK